MKQRLRILMVSAMLGVAGIVHANNISVNNIAFEQSGVGYTHVACDVAWDHSWRVSWTEVTPNITVTNWDAAWVFVKFRVATNNAPWQHATLSTNNSDHVVPSQALFTVGTSSNAVSANLGVGGFLYRKDEGSGNWSNRIKLRWNYAHDGVTDTSQVVISVHAIEMVYLPQGSFKVGSGGTESGSFTEGNAGTTWVSGTTPSVPFAITSEAVITITNTAGNLWGTATSGGNTIGSAGTLPGAYPKGYNAFYCMKYEISEGQWVSFFNMLTDSQKTPRDITSSTGKNSDNVTSRNTVAWTTGDATTAAPDRACSYLGWADFAAYADWAGLRPMTELEFEKACRGPMPPIAAEYVWGDATTLIAITNFTGGADGSGTETALPTNANCCYANKPAVQGPARCGIFATSASARANAGATYWGIMEMSGNLGERLVTAADAGRTFTGAVGDGVLDSTGNANAALWPANSNGTGASWRGGSWANPATYLRTSDRVSGANPNASRGNVYGGRCVRAAP